MLSFWFLMVGGVAAVLSSGGVLHENLNARLRGCPTDLSIATVFVLSGCGSLSRVRCPGSVV